MVYAGYTLQRAFLIVIVIVFIAKKKQKLRIQGFRGTLFSDKHIFLLINDFFLLNPIVAEYNCFVLNIHFLSS